MPEMHIEEFFADAARVLLSVYQYFPRPKTVYVDEISGPDEPDEYGIHSHRHLACFSAMTWLASENYINYIETIRDEAIDQATLTGACFVNLISPVPDKALNLKTRAKESKLLRRDQSTYAHQLRDAVQQGDGPRVFELMSSFMDKMQQDRK